MRRIGVLTNFNADDPGVTVKAIVEVTSQRFRVIRSISRSSPGLIQCKRSPINDHKLVG